MEVIYEKTAGLTDAALHYCPGCSHGIIHKLVAESLVELGVLDITIGVAPVGCSVLAYDYFNCDMQQAAHGRAPAVATGIRKVHPQSVVFTYQGDGDLAAIGTSEIIHAAHRGERITAIFVNNAIYGMTGGQMAPTTLVGQKATTAQSGRDEALYGKPLKVSEMISTIDGAKYVERVAVNTPANIRKAKNAIRKAFEYQIRGVGFSLVEVLAACPTNLGLTPVEALKWIEEDMIPYYPLRNFRDILGVE